MIGFQGTRYVKKNAVGTNEQHVHCPKESDKEFWRNIFPPDQKPVVRWESEMVLCLGQQQHMLRFQTTEERDEWRQTFLQGPLFEPVASWQGPDYLILSCRPAIMTMAVPAVSAFPDWSVLTDSQLRTEAVKLGVEIKVNEKGKPSEPRAVLIEKMKRALEPVGA